MNEEEKIKELSMWSQESLDAVDDHGKWHIAIGIMERSGHFKLKGISGTTSQPTWVFGPKRIELRAGKAIIMEAVQHIVAVGAELEYNRGVDAAITAAKRVKTTR